MVRNVSTDPLLLVVRQRQAEFIKEAASWRLVKEENRRSGTKDQRIRDENHVIRAAIWRKAAWTMGKAALSLGAWLMAR